MSTAPASSSSPYSSSSGNSASSSAKSSSSKSSSAIVPLALVGLFIVTLLMLWFYFTSRTSDTITSEYGKRRASGATDSVNGTSVLAEMFKATGRRVETINQLSPRLERYQTIVWFPDDFSPPSAEQREALEDWLFDGSGRVLIYVGRDYDARSDYYNDIRPLVKKEERSEFERRRATAKSQFDSARASMPKQGFSRWFTAKRDGKRTVVKSLSGPWAEGIDVTKTDLELQGRLDIPIESDRNATVDPALPTETEALLETDEGDVLVSSIIDEAYLGSGQIVVVANGGFVLNYPLVNHEHRKLAARLIAETDPKGKVAFLESGPGGPPVVDREPAEESQAAIAILKVWPLSAIMPHLVIFGVMLCLALSPIFGRPKELPRETLADFGKHVAALGQLLARTRDRGYALLRLEQYRQQGRRDSGRSHLK